MSVDGATMNGTPYHDLVRAVLASDLPPAAKVIQIFLVDIASDSGEAWPSIATISDACKVSVRHTKRIIRLLTDRNWLAMAPQQDRKSAKRLVTPMAPQGDADGTPECHTEHPRVTPVAPGGCHARHPTVLLTDSITDTGGEKKKKTATTKKAAPFTPPTVADVVAYNATLDEPIDDDECRRFVEWFEAREWHDSKNRKVRFWKSNFATWRSNHKPTKRSNGLPYENVVPMVDPGQEYVDAMFAEFRAKGIKY